MSKLNEYKELIRELAELLDKSTLSEIEVEEDDFRIRVAREAAAPLNYAVPAPMPAPAPVAAPAAPAVSAPVPEAAPTADHPGALKAPMVGTAYTRPAPDAEPFIQVGDVVKEGDTLFIIEAMKVMNNITATKSGKVKDVIVSDSQPVEFGEVLCVIE